MAEFTVQVASGVTVERWTDPASSTGKPSRVAPHPGKPQLYYRAKQSDTIVLKAVLGGVVAPADATLSGRLFAPFLTEGFGPPLFASPVGYSSIIAWNPVNPGHHVVGIRRPQGGAVLVHFDIEGTDADD